MGDTLTWLKAYCKNIKKNLPGHDHKEMARFWLGQVKLPKAIYLECMAYINDPKTWEVVDNGQKKM
jgi:hypothetical protein